MANQTVTYILWFFSGWLGVHHFYLKRDRHAFVWWATLGGVFGLGWVRDIWRIPHYVEECNEDEEFYKNKKESSHINGISKTSDPDQVLGDRIASHDSATQARNRTATKLVQGPATEEPDPMLEERQQVKTRVPNSSAVRFSGQLIMGSLFSYLLRLSVPEEYAKLDGIKYLVFFLPSFGAALGTHLVGNIGRHKCSLKWPLIGAFSALPWLYYSDDSMASSPLLATLFTTWWGKEYRTVPAPRRGLCKRLTVLSCCGVIYLLLLASTIYFNASVTIKDEETVPLHEAIHNFFKSPAWSDTKEQFQRLYNYYQAHGWHKIWEEVMAMLDPAGEANAYKVLELDNSATQEEITKRYRVLSRKWHPDLHKDPEEKLEAQEKFMEIQQAYEVISQIRAKRTQRNKQSTKNERTEF